MNRESISETMLDTTAILGETVLEVTEPLETMLDVSGRNTQERVNLSPGQTIAQNYVVIDCLSDGGSQANVYVARSGGKQCAIKMYNKGYTPSEEFVKALKNHDCPYVAKLYDYGYENGSYFEIYEYYGNGTLEDKGKCTISFIKDVIVPNLNEGFHFLHTLSGTGIVHGDIKPSNIFISNDESHVIIGDFGISSYLDKRGKLISEIQGTPEYAPRTVSFFGKATKSPAYDYGALGLVLIQLATGHSLFEGLNMTEITRMWEDGIEIPETIDSRLRRLITGLLIEDEKKRFGYDEVKKWCEGEYIKVTDNSLYSAEDFDAPVELDPLIFGIFGDRIVTVSTLKELSTAIAENWEHTKKQMKRTPFFEFLAQFDKGLEQDVREFSKLSDADEAVFRILYRIRKNANLVYKGINYGTAKEFVNTLKDDISVDTQAIIKQGLFEYFLEQNGYAPDLINQTHRIITLGSKSPQFVHQMLYYLFSHEKQLELNGKKISSPDELVDEIVSMDVDEIEALTQNTTLLAWLYSIGYRDDVLKFFEL